MTNTSDERAFCTSDLLYGACNYCERARQINNDIWWYCSALRRDFPDAEWDGEKGDKSDCSYFEYNGGYEKT